MRIATRTGQLAATAVLAVTFTDLGHAQAIRATLVTNGFDQSVVSVSPPGDARQFVCEQHLGEVRILQNGTILPTPFLDLGGQIATGTEQGLLGLAFHPDYSSNRKFYVSYTDTAGSSVVRSYLASAGNPDQADPASSQLVFGPLSQPTEIHNGGCIEFGHDGMLYLGLGDGGESNRSQDLGGEFGKLLRFDVDLPFPHVPADNPFVGNPSALDLIWAYGLRNPWRFSFDSETGDLWIADVGKTTREEISFQPASSNGGENYGWGCMEGTVCTNDAQAGCLCTDPLVLPVHEYPTYSNGTCSVIGGHLYRGQLMPSLRDRYVFTDLCPGTIWSFAWDGATVSDLTVHPTNITGPLQPVSLSVDANGEMFIMDKINGRVWALDEDCQPTTQNYCVTSPNSTGPGAIIGFSGSTSIAANDFVIRSTGGSLNQPGVFFYGGNQLQIPFGDGFRCVGSGGLGVYRLNPAMPTDGAGSAQRPVDYTQPPASFGPGMIEPGDTWNFQYWYRDPLAGASGFNLSDALEVGFCP